MENEIMYEPGLLTRLDDDDTYFDNMQKFDRLLEHRRTTTRTNQKRTECNVTAAYPCFRYGCGQVIFKEQNMTKHFQKIMDWDDNLTVEKSKEILIFPQCSCSHCQTNENATITFNIFNITSKKNTGLVQNYTQKWCKVCY